MTTCAHRRRRRASAHKRHSATRTIEYYYRAHLACDIVARVCVKPACEDKFCYRNAMRTLGLMPAKAIATMIYFNDGHADKILSPGAFECAPTRTLARLLAPFIAQGAHLTPNKLCARARDKCTVGNIEKLQCFGKKCERVAIARTSSL